MFKGTVTDQMANFMGTKIRRTNFNIVFTGELLELQALSWPWYQKCRITRWTMYNVSCWGAWPLVKLVPCLKEHFSQK